MEDSAATDAVSRRLHWHHTALEIRNQTLTGRWQLDLSRLTEKVHPISVTPHGLKQGNGIGCRLAVLVLPIEKGKGQRRGKEGEEV
jgi:hypothetical protein